MLTRFVFSNKNKNKKELYFLNRISMIATVVFFSHITKQKLDDFFLFLFLKQIFQGTIIYSQRAARKVLWNIKWDMHNSPAPAVES